MATKVTHTVSDTDSDHHPTTGTPSSSLHARQNDDRRPSSASNNSDSSFAGDQEGVPLQQLSKKRKKSKSKKLGPGFRPKPQGNGSDSDDNVLYNRRSKDDGDEGGLVVRWSQDGGSPRSLNKLREKHRRRSGRRAQRNTVYDDADAGDEGRIPRDLLFTPDEERKVVRKMDKYLVGFLAGLYMLSFLDRSSRYSLSLYDILKELKIYDVLYGLLLSNAVYAVLQNCNVDRLPNQLYISADGCLLFVMVDIGNVSDKTIPRLLGY